MITFLRVKFIVLNSYVINVSSYMYDLLRVLRNPMLIQNRQFVFLSFL